MFYASKLRIAELRFGQPEIVVPCEVMFMTQASCRVRVGDTRLIPDELELAFIGQKGRRRGKAVRRSPAYISFNFLDG